MMLQNIFIIIHNKFKGDDMDFWTALDNLTETSSVVIDRPKGSKHPKYDYIYEIDYGYLLNTSSSDGDGIDVWKGSLINQQPNAIICTIDLKKRDLEIKILLGCTEDEINIIMAFHNESEFMKGILIRRNNN